MQMYLGAKMSTLSVLAPAAIAGDYTSGSASFGAQDFDLTGDVALVRASGGASPTDGCDSRLCGPWSMAGRRPIPTLF